MNDIECCICNSNNWQNVDQYRMSPAGMCLCMTCGFVTYPEIIAKTEDLKEFYRNDYRDTPSVHAMFTGQRKLHYHNEFLADLFKEWKTAGVQPKVFEIGAAIGLFLKWVRDNFPKAEINGSELTTSHVRIAAHCHKVELGEEFDATKKYDLIATYKVAEHIPNIHNEIRKYAESLSEKGYLYISVPTWFHMLTNFGTGGFSLDYYYHKNHINVWTRKLFETLLQKCGLEIVKKDYVVYDSTYLCKRNDSLMSLPEEYEDAVDILDKMSKVKQAALAYDAGNYKEAVAIWPSFPEAIINGYEMSRAAWHKQGWEAIVQQVIHPAKLSCPEYHGITIFCADLCMRYSKWDEALKYLKESLTQKPNDPGSLIALASCFRQMADLATDPIDKSKLYVEAREAAKYLQHTSFEHTHNAMTWLFADSAKIPTQKEIASRSH